MTSSWNASSVSQKSEGIKINIRYLENEFDYVSLLISSTTIKTCTELRYQCCLMHSKPLVLSQLLYVISTRQYVEIRDWHCTYQTMKLKLFYRTSDKAVYLIWLTCKVNIDEGWYIWWWHHTNCIAGVCAKCSNVTTLLTEEPRSSLGTAWKVKALIMSYVCNHGIVCDMGQDLPHVLDFAIFVIISLGTLLVQTFILHKRQTIMARNNASCGLFESGVI